MINKNNAYQSLASKGIAMLGLALAELIPILRVSITYVVLDFDFATLTFAFKTFVTRL
jgi:hypothetical protein